ncbi:primosomal replication protein N [Paenalcaligenes faecalis]|uniref:primosomal replication protein N n=1 Tax=Paenalcaligenes faecalis TaxID=2980099 RepID=UPI0022B99F89|nr:primosomal replication protein N [Paenalcaligenes faecalis]
MNHLRFQGLVLTTKPLRYTPAGIAVCEIVLQHQSTVDQATIQRQLSFEIDAVAMGETANWLSSVSVGDTLDIQGFIAPLRQSSTRLVLHIQSFQNGNATPAALV